MNKIYRTVLFFLSLTLFAVSSAASSRYEEIFTSSSRLATGKWVKVSTAESGIYEISFDKLRELGFADPLKVGVFGWGGRALRENFTDPDGRIIYEDDLADVATYVEGDKLYFYARGVEDIRLDAINEEGLVSFSRKDRNIYSERGYYFLTETDEPLRMLQPAPAEGDAKEVTEGCDYIYHEVDLAQGNNNTGSLFWGENFDSRSPERQKWEYSAPDAIVPSDAMMQTIFFTQAKATGQFSFGVEGASRFFSVEATNPSSSNVRRPMSNNLGAISLPAKSGNVFVEFKTADHSSLSMARLDYWLLSYRKAIPTLQTETQSRLWLTGLNDQTLYSMPLACPKSVVIDLTDEMKPVILPRTGDAVTFVAADFYRHYHIFDTSREQKHPYGYFETANSDLHARAAEGADFLIISEKSLVDAARRLADFHLQNDSIRTLVATSDEIYNEFSSGRPDPMAFRALAKLVYEKSGKSLRNVLFMGTMLGDVKTKTDPDENSARMVIHESAWEAEETDGPNHLDFVANMNDFENKSYETRAKALGVGWLPFVSQQEADAYIDKLERYVKDETFAYRLNSFTTMGGVGDDMLHYSQAESLGTYMNNLNNNRFVVTNISNSAYADHGATDMFFEMLNKGNIINYFGHGDATAIDYNKKLFTGADVNLLSGTSGLPFMSFGGCNFTHSDRGVRGISESMVLSPKGGLIGSLTSMRYTWSSQNNTLMRLFYRQMSTFSHVESPITIGEIYARTKSASASSNSLNYVLICDPALRLVYPNYDIMLDNPNIADFHPGESRVIRGRIFIPDADEPRADQTFSGRAVVRFFAPLDSVPIRNYGGFDSRDTTYLCRDRQIAVFSGIVKNGDFAVKVTLPPSIQAYVGQNMSMSVAAYNPDSRLGASAIFPCSPAAGGSSDSNPFAEDNLAPVIEAVEYDRYSRTLLVSVADDTAVSTSTLPMQQSLGVTLDGQILTVSENLVRYVDSDRPAYTVRIPVPELRNGYHQVIVTAYDCAGNQGVSEKRILIGNDDSTARLELIEDMAVSSATIAILEDNGASQRELVIAGPDGEVVKVMKVGKERIEWDLTGPDGNRVARGLYRAMLRTWDSVSGTNSVTVPLVIPVI